MTNANIKINIDNSGIVSQLADNAKKSVGRVSILEFENLKVAISGGYDWTPCWNAAIQKIKDTNATEIYTPKNVYLFSQEMIIDVLDLTVTGDGLDETIFKKSGNHNLMWIKANNITLQNIQLLGDKDNGDTTDGLKIGQNDGANSNGVGYTNAQDCLLRNILITKMGNYGLNWQEGRGLITEHVRISECLNHGFYATDKALDVSHGNLVWIESFYNQADGFYFKGGGANYFGILKAFGNKNNGIYMNGGRNNGTIFTELNGVVDGVPGASGKGIVFGANSRANKFFIQHMNDGWNDLSTGDGTNVLEGQTREDTFTLVATTRMNVNELSVGSYFPKNASDPIPNTWGKLLLKSIDNDVLEWSAQNTSGDLITAHKKGTANSVLHHFNDGVNFKLGTTGTTISKHKSFTWTVDSPSIPANSMTEITINVGAGTFKKIGSNISATPSVGDIEAGLIWSVYISADDIVKLRIANFTVNPIDPVAREWRFDTWEHV